MWLDLLFAYQNRGRGGLANRAAYLPFSSFQLLGAAETGLKNAVLITRVGPFSIDGLGGGKHHTFHGKSVGDDDLEKQSRTGGVYIEEGAEVWHVVLIGGQMDNTLDSVEGLAHGDRIAYIALDSFDVCR